MFNPHIHQQQQQQHQQQLHQHLRQLQQLFQQQPPPPPPPQPPPAHHVGHHHQTPRAMPVPPQTAPPPRMVNLCQATQTTIIAPNPMLQGALLMQQMQGSMRGFGMGGQQFRQFFAAGTRSSLLGPVPMGMAMKSPIMGFPAARPYHPHARFFNTTATTTASSSSSSVSTTDTAARITDRKRDSEQMAPPSTDDEPAAASSSNEATDKIQTDGAAGSENEQISDEQLEEPVVKRQRTEGLEKSDEPCVVEMVTSAHSECNSSTEDIQPEGETACIIQEEDGSSRASDVDAQEETGANQAYGCLLSQSPSGRLGEEDQKINVPVEETPPPKDTSLVSPESQDEEEESVTEGSNKFYCYLCSITCHNQQNFRSHMNSISHQQRMMEIQYMSNACLVSLLPRVQESLQGANKDGEKKDSKRWCATCNTHFTCSIMDHHHSEEHKLACTTDISSCTICKKRFKTSQRFLEHLHSQEHRQKLQEKGGEALSKLTAMDTDGFSLEEEDGGEEEGEDRQMSERGKGCIQDGWGTIKEVSLNDMVSDEQYDPETVYGSSFLVPVAGFICRLCSKFYHFDSSAGHTHCKSLKHFENLRRLVSQKDEAVHPSRTSNVASGSLPVTGTTTDCSSEDVPPISTDVATNLNSMQPIITVTRLEMQEKELLEEEREETDLPISAVSTDNLNKDLSLLEGEEDNKSPTPAAQENPAEPPVGSREEADSEPAATPEDSNEEELGKDAPAGSGKKNGAGKAKTPAKRKSGRVTNRR